MFFDISKKHITPKLFHTLYRIDLIIDGREYYAQINQWNPFTDKLIIKNKYLILAEHLLRFGPEISKAMTQTGYVWVRDDTLDLICSRSEWPQEAHFRGCKKCDNFRFIPLMSFYSGCPVCNKDDHGSYTHFEASSRQVPIVL